LSMITRPSTVSLLPSSAKEEKTYAASSAKGRLPSQRTAKLSHWMSC